MEALDGKLRRHDGLRHERVQIGAERETVLVVDNFLADPAPVIEYAATQARFSPVHDAFYPGIRAPMPPIYSFAVRAFLGDIIRDAFALGDVVNERCSLSLVTTRPAELKPLQRLPHFDTTNPRQLAVLHYLGQPEQGGTSFYRHRSTGFETMSDARFPTYRETLARELRGLSALPTGYADADNPLFERTAVFEAAFNRVLVYRSVAFHSADIPPDFSFLEDPRAGRLTVNVFYHYR